jgi:translation initiation factor 2 beta subunit (eIF-2beta)/eIF-5
VNFKILISSIIAGSTLLTGGTTSAVNASGACANAPRGEKLERTGPDSWRVYATVRKAVKSKNVEMVEYEFERLELKAQKALARFVNREIKNFNNLDEKKQKSLVVVNDEQSDSLETFGEIVDQINASSDALLVASQEIGRCHEPGVQIMLTYGINSENISTASNINSPNSNNTGNDSQRGNFYRNDIDQGYNGYQNWENF